MTPSPISPAPGISIRSTEPNLEHVFVTMANNQKNAP